MLGLEQMTFQLRLAAMVLPVAVYFLLLGLLNSRRHPQMLTARQDFVLLMAAMSPVLLVPALGMLQGVLAAIVVAAVVVALGAMILTDRRRGEWVIYNLPQDQARRVIDRTLARLGIDSREIPTGLELTSEKASLEIRPFPLLRNVSIRVRGGNSDLAARLGNEIGRSLCGVQSQTTPMAMGLLIVATGMMVAPLAMVVHRAPELVRLITDLVH